MKHQPRKRFGQNFLKNQQIIDNIIRHIRPQPGDNIVEIGPGQGALTYPLLQAVQHITAIEQDRDLIPLLQAGSEQHGKLTLHQGDALKFNFQDIPNPPLRLVGNLPYNISTPLIFHLIQHIDHIQDMHFMLQKEVVNRLCATPGTKAYGRLGIMVGYFCEAEALLDVPPEAFNPPPKVDSQIVRLTPHPSPIYPVCDLEKLDQLVKQAFSQRRKTIQNALKSHLPPEALQRAGIDPGCRAENITITQYCQLALEDASETP